MLGALSFTSPFILAALTLLPLIWLLLRATPPSPRQVRFPAFVILRQLQSSEETPNRTPLWLLLLRLALAALVILALAGPILNAPPAAMRQGPIALIVDNSWAAAPQWALRRDALREAAAEADQSGRMVFLATTAPERVPSAIEPLTGEELRGRTDALAPAPFLADRQAALSRLAELESYAEAGAFEVRWLSDGVASPGDQAFADALRRLGPVTLFDDRRADKPVLRKSETTETGPGYRIERLNTGAPWEGVIIAIARDGRELARQNVQLEAGAASTEAALDLPLALRNELAFIRLENISAAGAVQLADARDRRPLIGLVTESRPASASLLSGAHYIREALGPYAEFISGEISEIIEANSSVIILDDIGAIRPGDVDALTGWVENGGVLIRFAGPVLADAAQDRTPPLLPVALRGGGRAFGGALTWDTPQKLDAFPDSGPFAGLTAPPDAFIKRQVLAQPGGETTERTWARLADGTPLVTGEQSGAGVIALFHVTATPDWPDLPISGVFIEMLRRLTFLSALGPETADENANARYAPLRLMDGFGRLNRPGDNAAALTSAELQQPASPLSPPGFYGAADAPLALNAVQEGTAYERLQVNGLSPVPYVAEPPVRLAPHLFLLGLLLLAIDALAMLYLAGKLRLRPAAATVFLAAIILLATAPSPVQAQQPLDAPIETLTAETALTTRLAYVRTGDPATDRLSEQAMAGLSRELYRRTALEPGPPAGVDLDTDDLSVFPFLYWPIVPDAETPSETALANIENFMRFGGLILFDTRDDERAFAAGSTPEGQALQRILSQLNIPPLMPLTPEHVLSRSFYLLSDLHGRLRNNPVWVAAETSGANDGVTPVIIGGRDWAGAWAMDSLGRELRPMGYRGLPNRVCTASPRECAYRAGVNIVMVAFTGNYKSDQVHTPILLERLGK